MLYEITNKCENNIKNRVNIFDEPKLGINRLCLGQKLNGKIFTAKLIAVNDNRQYFEIIQVPIESILRTVVI